jgi:hypothetical protein
MSRPADRDVVQVVNLVRMCQAFQALPLPGGLFNQDAYFVYLTNIVLEADNKRQERETAKVK